MPITPQEKEREKIIPIPEVEPEVFEQNVSQENRVDTGDTWLPEIVPTQETVATPETQEITLMEKSETLLEIKKRLSSENLTKIFNKLPMESEAGQNKKLEIPTKEKFAQKGDEAAKKIEALIQQELTLEKIQEIIHEWLLILPDTKNNDPFIEQEELNIIHSIAEYLEKELQKQIE